MTYVLGLDEIVRAQSALTGGKATNLAEVARVDEANVPDGFVVTTDAFRASLAGPPGLGQLIDELEHQDPDDLPSVGALSARIRQTIEHMPVPPEIDAAITDVLSQFGEHDAYAVRSSATAEDLPDASFAGQQDSYLNVAGAAPVVQHVRRCWASLFTDRAVIYRNRNGIPHRQVAMAVIVQRMVPAEVAGVLFTADPATSHRRISSVDAVRGLGEALVSGWVNADSYRVRDGGSVERVTTEGPPLLTDEQVRELTSLGRRIEAHFGHPQDIEWCLAGGTFHVVQSRPITTLFPVPEIDDSNNVDAGNHVYLSVGHQQMMTDAMTPLGLSMWQLITPSRMAEAGGRLFVDVAARLSTTAGRETLLGLFGRADPLTTSALRTLLDRGDVIGPPTDDEPSTAPTAEPPPEIPTDPAVVSELIEQSRSSVAALRRDIAGESGPELFDFIRDDIRGELKRDLFGPRSHQVIMMGMEASWWLNDHVEQWLGDRNVADVLTRSVPGNVTAEMGLALLDVADVVRPHPEVVAFLQQVEGSDGSGFLDALSGIAGGAETAAAIRAYLEEYGMRCAGEIDITRPRWSEQPATLVPTILAHVANVEPGESARRFQQGRREAQDEEHSVLTRLLQLPDGAQKADEAKTMIDRVRTFAGYREYPKYGMVSRTFLYKQALLAEAERLVRGGVLHEVDDIFFLRFDELHEAVRTRTADHALIALRREQFESYRALTPPRVFTADGEVITGTYGRDDLPAGALAGIAVSTGTVEGRARVVLDMAHADLEPGDILITAYTDPSWTPAFVTIAGLVTEVGSVMTHGAVIAREYGLPAVVAVEGATRLIPDGARIRVDGTAGHVEILD